MRRSSCRSGRRSPGPPRRTWGRTPSPRRRRSGGPAGSPARTPTPAHVRVWGEHADLDELAELPGSWRSGCGSPCSRARGGRCDDDRPVRPARPTAHRPDHDRAGGQRRHRQDLRARSPGHPLRRRGQGTARRHAADHVQPGGQPGAARAGPRPAGEGGRGARRPDPGRRRAAHPPGHRHRRRAGRPAPQPARRAGRLRRRDHRDHPPVLPAGAALARRGRRHRRRRHAGREPRRAGGRDRRRPLPPALRRREGHPRADPRPGAGAGARGRAQPAHPAHPDSTRRPRRRPAYAARSPTTSSASSSGASGCSASSASTTCCPGSRSRSRPTTRRPATG